jgi:PAS domain S-box-containing protein
MLSSEPYDGVISDYQMPLRDGLDLLAEVRVKYGALPFVLFTGRGREAVIIKALELGANFYIQKGGDPISQFTELFHKIRSAVERHQMQLQIAQNEALMGEAEKLAEMGSWSYDFETKNISFSPQMRLILGLPPGGALPIQDLARVIGDEASGGLIAAAMAAEASGSLGFAHEFMLKGKDGGTRHYKANILLAYGPNGKARSLTGVGQDISWLMDAKKNVEENARLSAILDTIDDIVIVTDTNGSVLRANRVGIEVFGMGEAWLTTQKIEDLVSGIDGSILPILGNKNDLPQGNVTRLRFLAPKGDGVYAEVRRSSGKWDGRDVVIFVARDISDRLRTEQALKDSEENFAPSSNRSLMTCKKRFSAYPELATTPGGENRAVHWNGHT